MIQMTYRTQGRGVSTLAEAGQGGEEYLLSYAGWGSLEQSQEERLSEDQGSG